MSATEDFICSTIEQILSYRHRGSYLTYDSIKSLPSYHTSGIYLLWGKRNILIYIGQSRNIKNRLHSHSVYDGTQLISFIPVSDKATRLETEKGLIFALKPLANDVTPAHYGTGARYDRLLTRLKNRRYTQLSFIR